MTDSPGSGQITQENFCLALQCDSIENDTHGHDSCLEDPFIDFDGVDSLTCSVIVFSESQSLATSVMKSNTKILLPPSRTMALRCWFDLTLTIKTHLGSRDDDILSAVDGISFCPRYYHIHRRWVGLPWHRFNSSRVREPA